MTLTAEAIKSSFFSLFSRQRTPNHIHVSALPFCLRKEYFNVRFNADPLPNAKMVKGKIMHHILKELDCFPPECTFEQEVGLKLDEIYTISGRVDAYDWERCIVYEFKFTSRKNSIELDPFYLAQANLYAHLLKAEKVALVKVNLNTFDVDVITADYDENAAKMLIQRAYTIIDCIKNNKLPHGPEREWECKNCPYNIVCSRLKQEE